MRICHGLPIVIAGLWIIAGTGSTRAASPVMHQYLIAIKLIQTMPDGKELLLPSPDLATDGRPACLDVHTDVPSPAGIKLDEPLLYGTYVLVKFFRQDGQLFLDGTVNRSEPSRNDAEGVHISTQSVRVVERITLGKKIVVHPPWDKTLRWELLVQEPQPKFAPLPLQSSSSPAQSPSTGYITTEASSMPRR